MAKLLKPYAKPEAFVNIDPNRSLLVMAGTPSELAELPATIETFDVDWLKGMSVGVFTLQHVEVAQADAGSAARSSAPKASRRSPACSASCRSSRPTRWS